MSKPLPLPPRATPRPVWNTYHGTRVRDDYQWLEKDDAPDVRKWVAGQNRYSRAWLDALPNRSKVARRLTGLLHKGFVFYGPPRFAGGRLFALRWDTRVGRAQLVVYDSPGKLERSRVLLDPAEWDMKGAAAAIDRFAPSWDGRYLAVCASLGGTESGDLRFYDARTGRPIPDVIPAVAKAGAGTDFAWTPDSRGLYYTRHPRKGEVAAEDLDFYQRVYFHQLGTPESEDKLVIGEKFPRIAETKIRTLPNRDTCVLSVAHGDGGTFEFWVGSVAGSWRQVASPRDQVVQAVPSPDGYLYLLSRKGAPRGKVLRVPLDQGKVSVATTVLKEGEWVVEYLVPTSDHLFVREELGGIERLRAISLRTRKSTQAKTPRVAGVPWVVPVEGNEVLFAANTYLAPPEVYRWDPSRGAARPTPLSSRPLTDLSRFEVVQEWATSKDGTRVPLTIVRPRGLRRNGEHPVYLSGYGGYGLSSLPGYVVWDIPWLESGGIVVVAHIRGGGEYGDHWHRDGMLTKKQNVFDDFIAVAEHLMKRGYTSPGKLAIEGGSNGGLLMGAVLTQRPDLFRAVSAHVGIFDSLRSERETNGQYNITEFGTVKDRKQFRALYAYSPYHRVVPGTRYPAVLLAAGDNDPRVAPYQSRKMAAQLQSGTASEEPVLLRTSGNSGHNMTRVNDIVELMADAQAFLMDRVGLSYRAKGPAPSRRKK